jgi:hypothetical protein
MEAILSSIADPISRHIAADRTEAQTALATHRGFGFHVSLEHFPLCWLHPSRRPQERAPQDEVPHGEERIFARLEPWALAEAAMILANRKTL